MWQVQSWGSPVLFSVVKTIILKNNFMSVLYIVVKPSQEQLSKQVIGDSDAGPEYL